MHILALGGWAQYAQSLDNVLPEGAEKVFYGDCASVEAAFSRIQSVGLSRPDIAVGWSLGGQLLVRATAVGIIRPKRLVLLAAPFQLVADKHFRGGKPRLMVAASRLALQADAGFMLRQFQADMLAQGDSNAAAIKEISPHYLAPVEGMEWLFWFDELARFSCNNLDFRAFPPTDIIHGDNDAVIPYANGEAFAAHIAGSRLHELEKCGHAPHWHDANFVKQVITGA